MNAKQRRSHGRVADDRRLSVQSMLTRITVAMSWLEELDPRDRPAYRALYLQRAKARRLLRSLP